MFRKLIYLFVAIAIFASCGDSGGPKPGTDTTGKNGTDEISDDSIPDDGSAVEIIQNFSNPVEMAALVKNVGAPFSMKYLCPTGNGDSYDTDFKKALGLGLLSADLGYLNIYEKTSEIIAYITLINRLADDLRVGQFFDFQTLKTLATQKDNLDSIMFLSVNSFNQMDDHLRTHGRSNLSALIVSGVWTEGLYLATQVYKETKNKDVGDRIGEQKIVLNELYVILKKYESDPSFAMLLQEFGDLKKLYEAVEITIEYGDLEVKEINGVKTFISKEKSVVTVSEQNLNLIIAKAEALRQKLISL